MNEPELNHFKLQYANKVLGHHYISCLCLLFFTFNFGERGHKILGGKTKGFTEDLDRESDL